MISITPYWLIISLLAFSFLPILIGTCSSYLKINIVLGMLRSGLGTQHAPSTLVIMVLSLALSAFVMAPVIEKCLERSDVIFNEFSEKKSSLKLDIEKLKDVFQPWQEFMKVHSGAYEIDVFQELAKSRYLSNSNDKHENNSSGIPLYVIFPAFILSELKEAFLMGFILLLPFLVIDLIVANILAGMGMYMLSPTMISLPLKLLFFVMADGWLLLSQSLITSY